MKKSLVFSERGLDDGPQYGSERTGRRLTVMTPTGAIALGGILKDNDGERESGGSETEVHQPEDTHYQPSSRTIVSTVTNEQAEQQPTGNGVSPQAVDDSRGGYHELEKPGLPTAYYTTEELTEFKQPGGFEKLVHQHYDQVYQLARKIVGENDAADVSQEVLLRAWKALSNGTFRGTSKISTWMYRVTANYSKTHLERRTRKAVGSLEDEDPERMLDLDREHRREELELLPIAREKLIKGLGDLPPKLRATLVLKCIYDLSHAEIAGKLGITEATSKVRVHRALKRLHASLDYRDI